MKDLWNVNKVYSILLYFILRVLLINTTLFQPYMVILSYTLCDKVFDPWLMHQSLTPDSLNIGQGQHNYKIYI